MAEELDNSAQHEGDVSSADLAGFGHFYDANAESVLRFFYRRTACPETAADLTAETFAVALGSLSNYQPSKGPTRAWLFGIARHQLARFIRWRRIDSRARQRLGMRAEVDLDSESRERIECVGADFVSLFRVGFSQHGRVAG